MVLAEDNPGDVFLIDTALRLEHLDVELIVERDGEKMLQLLEAVEAGQAACPDIVLMDLNLPKYGGDVLLQRMRTGRICAGVPVIIVTSSDAPNDHAIALRWHASGYFRKPTGYDEFMRLGSMVRSLLPAS